MRYDVKMTRRTWICVVGIEATLCCVATSHKPVTLFLVEIIGHWSYTYVGVDLYNIAQGILGVSRYSGSG